jgi:hypothetical protein
MLAFISLAVLAGCAEMGGSGEAEKKSVTQGLGTVMRADILDCTTRVAGTRAAPVGTITASDGTTWTVPAETAAQKGIGPKAGDLYNACNRVEPKSTKEVPALVEKTPIVEVDRDGEVVYGFIVADNYFEVYVNGKLVGVDSVPYTPSNGGIVRFRVKRPYTIALYVVDWEEDLGVGTEKGNPNNKLAPPFFYQGDGGVIAWFSDGTATDKSWKAQTYYIGPLKDPNVVVEKGNVHDTSQLGTFHPKAPSPGCETKCYAVHYRLPANWASSSFDDSKWPNAFEFTDEQVGVGAVPGYTTFPELYKGARWIWSSNLVYDNLVIARKTVR